MSAKKMMKASAVQTMPSAATESQAVAGTASVGLLSQAIGA